MPRKRLLGRLLIENAKSSMDVEGPLQYNNFLLECMFPMHCVIPMHCEIILIECILLSITEYWTGKVTSL